MIKNRILALLFRIFGLAGCCYTGYLIFTAQPTTYTIVIEPFTSHLTPFPQYFWVITTCFLSFLIIKGMLQIKKDGRSGQTTLTKHVRGGLMTTSILLVLYYHLLLAPSLVVKSNGLLHLILYDLIPLFWLLDWILFDVRQQSKKYDPWLWLLLQVYVYVGVILIRAQSTKSINPFVHDVLNVERYGFAGIMKNVIIVSVLFLIIGYLIGAIDSIGKPKGEKTEQASKREKVR